MLVCKYKRTLACDVGGDFAAKPFDLEQSLFLALHLLLWSFFTLSQVEEELLEQEFLERCFQEMLDEEDQDWFIPARDLPPGMGQIQQQFNGLSVSGSSNTEEIVVSFKTWL